MRAEFDATGDVLVVTGGANGISRAVAEAAAEAGAKVTVLDIAARPTDLDERIHYIETDISDRRQLEDTAGQIADRDGAVNGLLCGAVIQPRSSVLELSSEEWHRVQQVNLDGVLWCCQVFVPLMISGGGGSIVIFTSGIATSGWPKAAAYSTTKAAAQGLARTLAAEVADSNVKVNLISPGVVDTPQYRSANPPEDRDHWKSTVGVGDPSDTVGPILFLLSDAATMTGSLLARERPFGGST